MALIKTYNDSMTATTIEEVIQQLTAYGIPGARIGKGIAAFRDICKTETIAAVLAKANLDPEEDVLGCAHVLHLKYGENFRHSINDPDAYEIYLALLRMWSEQPAPTDQEIYEQFEKEAVEQTKTLEDHVAGFLGMTRQELEKLSESASPFIVEDREYHIITFGDWTRRQNKELRKLWFYIREEYFRQQVITDGQVDEEKERTFDLSFDPHKMFSFMQTLLLDSEEWNRFYSLLYLPKGVTKYNEKKAQEYWEDFDDLSNKQAFGALYFFITRSIDSFPNAIQHFLRKGELAKLLTSKKNAVSHESGENLPTE